VVAVRFPDSPEIDVSEKRRKINIEKRGTGGRGACCLADDHSMWCGDGCHLS
jgi:hypothetical protein